MKKNKWVLLLIAFVAFLVLVYFILASHWVKLATAVLAAE